MAEKRNSHHDSSATETVTYNAKWNQWLCRGREGTGVGEGVTLNSLHPAGMLEWKGPL